MNIHVTFGEFDRIHRKAREARQMVRVLGNPKRAPDRILKRLLSDLKAGQGLSNAETGSDFMYAPDYREEIRIIENVLGRK